VTETITGPVGFTDNQYPDSIGFGFAEIITLLNLHRGDAASATAHALRVENELDDVRMISAGASSLVARGLGTAEPNGELSVAGPVAAVTSALTSAVRRMEISLLVSGAGDSVLSMESEDYRIILQPRAYLTWFAMAQNPDISAAEANFYIMRKHLSDNPAGGATLLRREDPDRRRLLLKRGAVGWTVGYISQGENEVQGEISGLSDAQVLEHIRKIRNEG
jgi:hypothetical protein